MNKHLQSFLKNFYIFTAAALGIVIILSFGSAQTNLNFSFKKLLSKSKTESIEDFETGNFTQFDWQMGGNQPWTITDSTSYEGSYCARSGVIGNNHESWISLTYDVYSAENITFWYSVSSEPNYDYLKFTIDNVELGSWSGYVPWTQASYPVTAGTHTFKWRYYKDGSVVSGSDAAVIDYIVFPPMELEALFTSDTTVICEGDVVQFFDQSVGPITEWDWIFEGGFPSTSTEQNPVVGYTTAGSYDVLLTVSDGIESANIYMGNYITVGEVPAICPTPTGITYLCASWGNSSYTTTGLTGITLYDWQIQPPDAGTISGTGKNITVVWTENFLGTATLKVAGVNYCGIGVYSNALSVTRYLPNVTLAPFPSVSISTPPFALTGGLPSGGDYSGPGVSNNIFSPLLAGLGTHTITYTYEDANFCENFAQNTLTVTAITGLNENSGISGISILPNPNSGDFTISVKHYENTNISIGIFNSLNQKVYELNEFFLEKDLAENISIQGFPKGLYILHVSGEGISYAKKLIVR